MGGSPVLRRLRSAWSLLRWDVAMRCHQRATRRRVVQLLGPHAEPGVGLARVLEQLSDAESAEVDDALPRVDLHAYRGHHHVSKLYAFLDELGGGRG